MARPATLARTLATLALLAALPGLAAHAQAADPVHAVAPPQPPGTSALGLPGPHTLTDPAIQAAWTPAQHRLYDHAVADDHAPHDWRLIARGTNVVLRYDANSLHRDGNDVQVLQTSQVLNPRGSAFLAHTFQYAGTGQVHALINDIEFDCAAPRQKMLAQWLDDNAGDILQLRYGSKRWGPSSGDFADMRLKFCAAAGRPATTLARELAAWHKTSAGREAVPGARPKTTAAADAQSLGPDSMFGLNLQFFLIAMAAGLYNLASVVFGFEQVLNLRTFSWTDLNTKRAHRECLAVGILFVLSALILPKIFDRGRFFTDLATACMVTVSDLVQRLRVGLG